MYNAADEVAKAANYPMIRLFTAELKESTTPVDELLGITEPWSVASPGWLVSHACLNHRIAMNNLTKRYGYLYRGC